MVAPDETIIKLISLLKMAYVGYVDQPLRELGLYPGQEPLLLYVAQQEGQTQVQLAQSMGSEPQTTHKALRRMQQVGLVERQPDPEDGRLTRVYLTARGHALVPAVQEIVDRGQERLTAGLTVEEKIVIRRLLMQMLLNLEQS